jgi:hypothetical protein
MSAEWEAAMKPYRMAKLRADNEWEAFKSLPDDHAGREVYGENADQSGEEESAAHTALFDMPAPDVVPLLWDLDHVITFESDQDGEYMIAWSRSYVRQTIADYHRMLGGAVAPELVDEP